MPWTGALEWCPIMVYTILHRTKHRVQSNMVSMGHIQRNVTVQYLQKYHSTQVITEPSKRTCIQLVYQVVDTRVSINLQKTTFYENVSQNHQTGSNTWLVSTEVINKSKEIPVRTNCSMQSHQTKSLQKLCIRRMQNYIQLTAVNLTNLNIFQIYFIKTMQAQRLS